jgi:uncharacterized protein (DUF1501 family)
MHEHDHSHSVACRGFARFTRRSLLQSSALAAGGLWLTQLAERLAVASESKSSPPKSLLMIWLQGGPSQLETFDPHAGTRIGGQVKAIPTTQKGIELADTLPATAEQLHHACLVRSMISKEGDHERATYHLKTGWRPEPTVIHPSIGAVLCHQSPNNIEIPRHISIVPSQWPARAGYLGPSFDAFQIGDPAEPIPNLTRRVSEDQMKTRLGPLLNTLESEFQRGRLANLDRQRTVHRIATDRAVTMMSSEQLTAFDVKSEGAETLERFGDNPFGRGCLAGIRLLSAGVRCVEVELNGWDSHINNHQFQSSQAQLLDGALASTLSELSLRGLLDSTVVFCGGEFGRTPRINPAEGRDHWPHGFSVLLAGGSFRRGHVHGATAAEVDDRAGDLTKFTSSPVTVPDLHATLLHALGVAHEQENMTPIGRPLRWSDGKVVSQLLNS